ncbi:MAG: DUF3667 domain-containing protein [Bacteroidota bacterium]
MPLCPNCSTPIDQNYCPNCGRAATLKRIDGHYIQHEIEHVLHFEKGILFTVRELLFRPGKNVKEFINGDRNRLVKPIIFIIITSLLYSLSNHFFQQKDGYVNIGSDKSSSVGAISAWVRSHYGYGNILMGVFIAFWLKLFFRKYQYNFYEILILLCFVMGMGMLFLAIASLLEGLIKLPLMQAGSAILIVYFPWSIGQFFNGSKTSSYVKALCAYILGMLSFVGAIYLIGFLYDSMFK